MRIGGRIGWYLWRALLCCSARMRVTPGPVSAQCLADVESQLLDARERLAQVRLHLAEEELQDA
jgi:hypothetical protein